jgi:hypothetical protein
MVITTLSTCLIVLFAQQNLIISTSTSSLALPQLSHQLIAVVITVSYSLTDDEIRIMLHFWFDILSCYFRSLPCGIKRGTLTFSISAFFTCTNVIFSDGSHIPPSAEACFFFSAGRVEVFEAEIPKHNTRKKSSFTSSLTDYERLL